MTAAVVGTAAHVGANHANKQAAEHEQDLYQQQVIAQQQADIAALQAQQASAAPAAPAAAPAAPVDPLMAQMQNLASLHAAGILSDEEFAAATAKALGM